MVQRQKTIEKPSSLMKKTLEKPLIPMVDMWKPLTFHRAQKFTIVMVYLQTTQIRNSCCCLSRKRWMTYVSTFDQVFGPHRFYLHNHWWRRAQRAWRTKSRGPIGLQLEVGSQGTLRLLVINMMFVVFFPPSVSDNIRMRAECKTKVFFRTADQSLVQAG